MQNAKKAQKLFIFKDCAKNKKKFEKVTKSTKYEMIQK